MRATEETRGNDDIAFAQTELGDPLDEEGVTVVQTPAQIASQLDAVARVSANDTLSARPTVLPRVGAGASPALSDAPRFETLRKLGEGGMGEVALVADRDIDRTVAVKRLLHGPRASLDALVRFAREVRTVGRLEHPNIVPIHDVGIDNDGSHYFVMKYVEGETLETIIDKLAARDPAYLLHYTIERRTEIFVDVLRAIQYAHAKGIIHRDIKPSNIMVGRYGEVMVMDWGVAKELRRPDDAAGEPPGDGGGQAPDEPRQLFRTRHGALLGTPAYMSPEQARGEVSKIDERSDTYSLTVMFHHLLSLRHYQADKTSLSDMLHAIGHDPEPRFFGWATGLNKAGVPVELVYFLQRGMKKSPADRFQTVSEMIEVLNTVRDHRIRVQCHVTFLKRGINELGHVLDRYPHVVTAAVLLCIALMLLGGVSLVAMMV